MDYAKRRFEKPLIWMAILALAFVASCGDDRAGEIERTIENGVSRLEYSYYPGYTTAEYDFRILLKLDLEENTFDTSVVSLRQDDSDSDCSGSGVVTQSEISELMEVLDGLQLKNGDECPVVLDAGSQSVEIDGSTLLFESCSKGGYPYVKEGRCQLLSILQKLFKVDDPDICPETYLSSFSFDC